MKLWTDCRMDIINMIAAIESSWKHIPFFFKKKLETYLEGPFRSTLVYFGLILSIQSTSV